jgi:hypothetical protein
MSFHQLAVSSNQWKAFTYEGQGKEIALKGKARYKPPKERQGTSLQRKGKVQASKGKARYKPPKAREGASL